MFIKRVLTAFDKAGVDYALAGGYAVALHGAVRGTVDIDVVLTLNVNNLTRAVSALESLGLQSALPLKADQVIAFRKEYIENRHLIAWNFTNPKDPSEIVDIILTHDAGKMKTAKIRLGEIKITVLTIQELIKMKKQSGRPQDIEDIRALERLTK